MPQERTRSRLEDRGRLAPRPRQQKKQESHQDQATQSGAGTEIQIGVRGGGIGAEAEVESGGHIAGTEIAVETGTTGMAGMVEGLEEIAVGAQKIASVADGIGTGVGSLAGGIVRVRRSIVGEVAALMTVDSATW